MRILTDRAADLPAEEAAALGIHIAPLFIQFPEGEIDSSEITADDFYTRLARMRPEFPTTAQPSPGLLAELFETITPPGEELIAVHVSSGLSGTVNAARLAAEQVKDRVVHVIDSLTLSGGQRFQVLAAAKMAAAGASLQSIVVRMAEIQQASEVIYTLDTLEYLARGGRIGRVQAIAGALLNIKPIIRVEPLDGKYSSVGRVRTIGRALEELADHLAKIYAGELVWVSVMHGQFQEQAEKLALLLQERLEIEKLEILRISPVLGVHTGPGIVGATVVPMRLMP